MCRSNTTIFALNRRQNAFVETFKCSSTASENRVCSCLEWIKQSISALLSTSANHQIDSSCCYLENQNRFS